jgi:hypothetical protein
LQERLKSINDEKSWVDIWPIQFFFVHLHCKTKRDKDMANLTRVGTKGLELTREEVIDITSEVTALIRKAQCREVNCEVIDLLDDIDRRLADVDEYITKILEEYE